MPKMPQVGSLPAHAALARASSTSAIVLGPLLDVPQDGFAQGRRVGTTTAALELIDESVSKPLVGDPIGIWIGEDDLVDVGPRSWLSVDGHLDEDQELIRAGQRPSHARTCSPQAGLLGELADRGGLGRLPHLDESRDQCPRASRPIMPSA